MNMIKCVIITVLLLSGSVVSSQGQTLSISGKVTTAENNTPITGATIILEEEGIQTSTDRRGNYLLTNLSPGAYRLNASYPGLNAQVIAVPLYQADTVVDISLELPSYDLEDVTIEEEETSSFGISRLDDVEGAAIYAAKKNEVILVDEITANIATNNSRQIYAKVPGLNIWESDGAGVQLGIGGRGLSPNRSSNFNTRQNGYDISADALGYPESYYTPPVAALEKIEIVRGAASLQYGTQFGGMLNFRFKQGPGDKKMEWTLRQTAGSFGLFNSFNSVGGTVGNTSYYGFYQYKRSNGWRPNSELEQHTAYGSVKIQVTQRFSFKTEYTFNQYLAQQPGGLTDAQFEQDPRQSLRERNWFRVNWNLFALHFDYDLSPSTRLNSRTFGLVAGRDALGNLDPINLLDFGDNRDFLSDDFRNWGNETRIIHQYNTFDNPSIFLTGVRYYDGLTLRRQGEGNNQAGPDFYYLDPDDLEGSDFELPSKNFAWFAENIFNLTPQWSLTPGIRVEYIKTESEGYYKNRVEDLAGNVILDERVIEQKTNERSFIFFGVGVSYEPSSAVELYGNFSQNYRAINFNDIRVNVGSLVVDPQLKDERGFNADLGIRGNVSEKFNFDVSAFYLYYSDRIGTVLKTEPNPQFNNLVDRVIRFRTNVADADIYGVESFAEIDLWKLFIDESSETGLSIFANIAWIKATYNESEENGIEGNEVELVPEINLKAGIQIRWRGFESVFQYAYVGRQFSDATNAIRTPTAIEGIIPAYEVMDWSMSYTFKRFSFETGINNLTNNFYFTRRATGYPGPGILPSDGRSLYATIEVKF